MNGMALCAGIGGIELGLQLLFGNSYKTVCWVEREAYPAACIVKRMQEGLIHKAPLWSDLKTFDGNPWRGKVHILTGGYPCQPFSCAGKQKAENDPRHLWPDILRIVEEVEAPILFFENVANHLNLGLIEVRKSLREMGYRVKAGIFSAQDVGATHRRKRLFLLAYANSEQYDWCRHARERRWQQPPDRSKSLGNPHRERQLQQIRIEQEIRGWPSNPSIKPLGHPYGTGLEGRSYSLPQRPHELFAWPPSPKDAALWEMCRCEWFPATEPNLRRVVDGFSDAMEPSRHRTHRLRALGNAVLPLVAAYAFNTLLDDRGQ